MYNCVVLLQTWDRVRTHTYYDLNVRISIKINVHASFERARAPNSIRLYACISRSFFLYIIYIRSVLRLLTRRLQNMWGTDFRFGFLYSDKRDRWRFTFR